MVLRSFKYKESSIICDVYTRDYGLKSYIVSGVRSKKNIGKANLFQPATMVNLTAYNSQGDKLSRIKEISYLNHYQNINQDVLVSCVSTFLIEVCRKSIIDSDPNEELYHFLISRFTDLDVKKIKLSLFHIKFLLDLSQFLGFAPYNNYSLEDCDVFDLKEGLFVNKLSQSTKFLGQETSRALAAIMSCEYSNINDLSIPKTHQKDILNGIVDFYRFHVDGFGELKSLEVILVLLA